MTDNYEKKKTAVALGFFDGLHLGHIEVLKAVADKKDSGLMPCVLLFDEHPKTVLTGSRIGRLIQNEKRDAVFYSMGIRRICASFISLMNMKPREFVCGYLKEELGASFVACGYNYRFGEGGEGDTRLLKELCDECGIGLFVCPEVKKDGVSVSSTNIRELLSRGKMREANSLLGRPYGFTAPVFHGDRRGRTLGAPTINQYIPDGLAVPEFGVYLSRVGFDGKQFDGVTNIGNRPTFDGVSVRSETYILGYSGDLYNRWVDIELIDFIRPEKRFSSVGELIKQIEADCDTAKKLKEQTEKY